LFNVSLYVSDGLKADASSGIVEITLKMKEARKKRDLPFPSLTRE